MTSRNPVRRLLLCTLLVTLFATSMTATTSSHVLAAPTHEAAPTSTSSSLTVWRPPIAGPITVVRAFDPPARRWLPGHRGVDLKAKEGTPVRSAGPGVVVFAGDLAGRPVVSIEHAPGVRTTYEPVAAGVAVGTRVRGGRTIGHVVSSAAHRNRLHWGLKVRGRYINPLFLLGAARIELKPSSERLARQARG